MVDRSQLVDGMTPITSYSCIMEDLTAPEYSNAFAGIPASSEARIGNINSNVFYVKPDIGSMWWGYEQGRWSSRYRLKKLYPAILVCQNNSGATLYRLVG